MANVPLNVRVVVFVASNQQLPERDFPAIVMAAKSTAHVLLERGDVAVEHRPVLDPNEPPNQLVIVFGAAGEPKIRTVKPINGG